MKQIYFFIVAFLFLGLIFLGNFGNKISLAPGDSNSEFVSFQVPSLMQAGEPYQISVTYRNTGITTWTLEEGFFLGNQYFGQIDTFGNGRMTLDENEAISPGEQKTFTYFVSAPQDAGTYSLRLKMVHELVEWFGDETPQVQVTVEDHRLMDSGNALPEPALAWISRSSNGLGAWLIDRPDDSPPGEEGNPCPSGLGWQNTWLVSSQLNNDGTLSRKKILGSNCLGGTPSNLAPWGDVPDLHQYFPNQFLQGSTIIPPHWSIVKSNGLRVSTVTGQFLEEYHPEPGLVILPTEIIPDGQEHITQKCYINPIYFNEQVDGVCYDATCSAGSGLCPGSNRMINTKYRVYEYCQGDFCYANGETIFVPVNFGERLDSVLRVSYTSASGTCTGAPILTEEQWYAEGIGLIGFSNDHPLSPAPNSVDFHGVFENNQCLPYWDNLCKAEEYNYNQCCPDGHSLCNVYRNDKILPSITLSNPLPSSNLNGQVTVSADATDNTGVAKVEFYLNNRLISTDTSSPYNYVLDTTLMNNGVHKITARVYDLENNFVTTPIDRFNIVNTALDSDFISQQVPSEMIVGQTYQVNITFRNIGLNSWNISNYLLSSQNNYWGIQTVSLNTGEIISNGQEKTFTFKVIAPSTVGQYQFSWGMRNQNVAFGDLNNNLVINVINQPSSTTGSGSGSSSGGSGGGSSGGSSGSGVRPSVTQCNDKIDNDNDGSIDYPNDLGCSSLNDNNEIDETLPTQIDVTERESDELPISENEFKIPIIFWTVLTIIISLILFVSIGIIRMLRLKRK